VNFEHETLGQRVFFGSGKANEYLKQEVERRAATNIMVIASKREMVRAENVLDRVDVSIVHDDVVQHVPFHNAQRARRTAVDNDIDFVVSIGGGSATGLAKAVALTTGLPIVAVPTTYAGSEATDVWGITQGGKKTTGVDRRALPATVIYDAQLTLTMPPELSISSGLNALAHCVDSLWAPHADPINAAMATEGIRALSQGLPAVAATPDDLRGREHTLYGAHLAAVAFASAGSGMHHKICHALGGRFNLPHAQMHAVMLPYVLAFNATTVPAVAERIANALGSDNAVEGLSALHTSLGAPKALSDYGLAESDLDEAAQLILPLIPASNPRPVTPENLTRLLRSAWAGDAPTARA
jgi:maleylacetate reductase